MIVAQVNTEDLGGGAARIAWDLFRGLPERGHVSRLVVNRRRTSVRGVIPLHDGYGTARQRLFGALDRWVERAFRARRGVYHVRRTLHRLASPELSRNEWAGRLPGPYSGTEHLLDQLDVRPDIVHLHNLHGHYFDLRALSRLSGQATLVWTLHDEWAFTGICTYTLDCHRWRDGCGQCPQIGITYAGPDATAQNWEAKSKIYSTSNLVVCSPSRWLLDRAEESILQARAFLHVPNGIDTATFLPGRRKAARENLGISDDVSVLVFAANRALSSPRKNFATLREAVRRLPDLMPGTHPILVCLGADRAVEEVPGVEVRPVPFESRPDALARWYQAADVYVHPALAENQPLTILEALSCGTPVVAAAVGGVPEIVEEGRTGYLVAQDDAAAMAERIAKILNNPVLRDRMGNEGGRVVRERHSVDGMVDRYVDVYESLGTGGGRND